MTNNKVLVVAPHIDDEVLGLGGTIAKHVDAGDHVSVMFVTDREPPREEIQRDQALLAQKVLGYQEAYFMGMTDMYLDLASCQLIQSLEADYNQIQPDIVYTCWAGDYHVDHQRVARAVKVVCRPLGPNPPREMYSYEIPQYTASESLDRGANFTANVFNTISTEHVDRKLEAFQKYTDEIEEYPHPRSVDGIINFLTYRGMCAKTEFAEAFMLMRNNKA